MNNFVSDEMLKSILEGALWDDEVKKAPIVEAKTEEAPKVHTCPLCESNLNAEISEEKLAEHFEAVLGLAESVLEENAEDESMDEESLTEDELLEAIEEMSDDEFEDYVASLTEEEADALTELLEAADKEDEDEDDDSDDEDDEEDED